MPRRKEQTPKQILSFALFRELPPELRNQIWVFGLPDPRIVALQEYRKPVAGAAQKYSTQVSSARENPPSSSSSHITNQDSVLVVKSKSCVPALYQVCHESRVIFEQFYMKLFKIENSPGLWINIRRDILYLPHDLIYLWAYEDFGLDIRKVKILALKDIWSREENGSKIYRDGSLERIVEMLQDLGNLAVLMLINAQHRPDNTAQLHLVTDDSSDEVAKQYSQWIRRRVDSSVLIHPFSWPKFEVGIFIDGHDPNSRLQDVLKRKYRIWKEMFRSAFDNGWGVLLMVMILIQGCQENL